MSSYQRHVFELFVIIVAFICLMKSTDGRSIRESQYREGNNACPDGNYYDSENRRCRSFPGGGKVVHVDYYKRCSNNYLGPKVHPDYNQYYYVCKKDSVVFGKCPTDQMFNSTISQCVNPFSSDEQDEEDENDSKKQLRCPENTAYCRLTKKCSHSMTINPDDLFDHFDVNTYPACKRPGRFRSPADCSLYFTCSAKTNGHFYQTRYRCPAGTLYDIEKEKCRHKKLVKCEYITIEDIIEDYERTHRDDSDYFDLYENSDEYKDKNHTTFIKSTTHKAIITSTIPTTTRNTTKIITTTEIIDTTIPATIINTTTKITTVHITPFNTTTELPQANSTTDHFDPSEPGEEKTDYPSSDRDDFSESTTESPLSPLTNLDQTEFTSTPTTAMDTMEYTTLDEKGVTTELVVTNDVYTEDYTSSLTTSNPRSSESDNSNESVYTTTPVNSGMLTTSEDIATDLTEDIESTQYTRTTALDEMTTTSKSEIRDYEVSTTAEETSEITDSSFSYSTTALPKDSSLAIEELKTTAVSYSTTPMLSTTNMNNIGATNPETDDPSEYSPISDNSEDTTIYYTTDIPIPISSKSTNNEIHSTDELPRTSHENDATTDLSSESIANTEDHTEASNTTSNPDNFEYSTTEEYPITTPANLDVLSTSEISTNEETNLTTYEYESSSNSNIYSTVSSEELTNVSTFITESNINNNETSSTVEYEEITQEINTEEPSERPEDSEDKSSTTERTTLPYSTTSSEGTKAMEMETTSSNDEEITLPTEDYTDSNTRHDMFSSTDHSNAKFDYTTDKYEYESSSSQRIYSTASLQELSDLTESDTSDDTTSPTEEDEDTTNTTNTVVTSETDERFGDSTAPITEQNDNGLTTDPALSENSKVPYSSEIETTTSLTGSSLIKIDSSTQTSYPEETNNSPEIPEQTESDNQFSTTVEPDETPPCKNTTTTINVDDFSSSYNFKDKSISTVRLYSSKPLEIQIYLQPKTGCEDCPENKETTKTDTTNIPAKKKSLDLHFS